MKRLFSWLAAVSLAAGIGPLSGQTILWHNSVEDSLADSGGNPLDSGFAFELGAFVDGFAPTESNVADWFENWLVFDVADFNPVLGYFTGEAVMNSSGTTDSPPMTPGAPSFEGKQAYIWVRKGTEALPLSEWMLVSNASWVFPQADPDCCPNGVPLEWAISDLDGDDTPKWGSQDGVTGPGVEFVPGSYVLQTHTFLPEPSSAVFLLGSLALVWLRRR